MHSKTGRAWLTTKIHALTDTATCPVAMTLTPGQAGDNPALLPLVDGYFSAEATADGAGLATGSTASTTAATLDAAGTTTTAGADVAAAVGTSVERGDVVGHVGAHPGHCAPDTCVHWGVRVGDDYLDPALLLAEVRIVLLPLRA